MSIIIGNNIVGGGNNTLITVLDSSPWILQDGIWNGDGIWRGTSIWGSI